MGQGQCRLWTAAWCSHIFRVLTLSKGAERITDTWDPKSAKPFQQPISKCLPDSQHPLWHTDPRSEESIPEALSHAMRRQQAPQPLLNLTLWITTLLLLFLMLWFPHVSPGQFSAHWKSEAVAVVRPLQTAAAADTQQILKCLLLLQTKLQHHQAAKCLPENSKMIPSTLSWGINHHLIVNSQNKWGKLKLSFSPCGKCGRAAAGAGFSGGHATNGSHQLQGAQSGIWTEVAPCVLLSLFPQWQQSSCHHRQWGLEPILGSQGLGWGQVTPLTPLSVLSGAKWNLKLSVQGEHLRADVLAR